MKAHTIEFKNQLTELGRELRGIITYNNTTLEEEIYSITPHYNADLLKSVMKQLDIELSVDIPLNTIINCQIGIKVNEQYEMLNYGNYVVYKSEKQEDTRTYKITCYDKLLYSMKQNEDLGIEYPIKIKDYLIALGNKIGLSVANTTFYNQDMKIPSELYLGQDYTYRDILDEIAQATGSIICLNENDQIVVKYPTKTNDTIDEDFLKDVNVDFGQKYGVINSIVLSRSGESDNVYLRDEDSVAQNGLTEVKIVDNQIMNFNNRSDYLQGILNALNGLYYYLNDFNSTGILYYEVGDLYNVRIGENTYQCLMLNDEINVTTGIEEIIHTDMPEKSETDYSKADKTDMKINKTYLIVDKQNQKIESVVNNVTKQNDKISKITQTVDEINSKIQDIADITTYGESDRAEVELTDVNESEPIMIKVHPTSTNISYLYPRENLYPSDLQYLPNRIIRFTRTYEEDGTTKTENIDYELPDDLLRYSSEVYDEFILDYDSQTCQVIKRCAYNADGTVRALGTEITTDYEYPTILLGEGNYTITLPGYDYGYLYARLMAKNIYTTQFYTKVETDSRINQKANEINLGVNQTLTNYSTTNEMNSAINIKSNEITSSVSKTYSTKQELATAKSEIKQTTDSITSTVSKKVGNDEVISKINQSSEAVTINANKIDIDGKAVHFKTNISVRIGPFTNQDLTKLVNYLMGTGTLTAEEKQRYDIIGDGTLSPTDVLLMRKAINNGGYYTFSGYYEIDPYSYNKSIRIYDNNNNKFQIILSLIYNYIHYLYTEGINVNGQLVVENEYGKMFTQANNKFELYVDGYIRAEHQITCENLIQTSKEENKKNFEKLQNALEIIKSIDIYKYNMKSQEDKEKKHIGFVIGDNYNYSKEVTSIDNEGVDNYSFTSLCCKAIQEQQEEIEELKKEIEKLKGGK